MAIPTVPAVKTSGWKHKKLISAQLRPVQEELRELRAARLTVVVVAKEFIRCCITPLQKRSRPVWEITEAEDRIRLSKENLHAEAVTEALKALLTAKLDARPKGARPLYRLANRDDLVAEMHLFDQWGLVPAGHMGPRGNPLGAEPISGSHDDTEASMTSDEESNKGTPPSVNCQLRLDASDDDGDDGDGDDDNNAFRVMPAVGDTSESHAASSGGSPG